MSSKSPETKAKMAEARKKWWESRTEEEKKAYAEKQHKPHPKTSEVMRGRKPSEAAVAALHEKQGRSLTEIQVKCENPNCRNIIGRTAKEVEQGTHRFCNEECYFAWRKAKWEGQIAGSQSVYACQVCGKEFKRKTSREKYGAGKYCSRVCAEKGRVGEDSPQWGGGIHQRKDGYVDVNQSLVPKNFRSMIRQQGKVMQHRLVMAQHLDRPLRTHEVVHHKDGNRSNNSIDNLEMHSAYAHDGITADSNKKSAEMQREIKRLLSKVSDLEDTVVSLRAEIEKMQEKLRSLEG